MTSRVIGGIALAVAAAVGLVAAYALYAPQRPVVFSDGALLAGLWHAYSQEYVEAGTGRTLDRQRQNVTTSEGQSYTLLRAVWMDDRPAFDQAWQWTKDNLQRPDGLDSWLFGQRADGSYGVLTDQGGENSASDADTDIALALAMAAARWQDARYIDDARKVMEGIWENDVIEIDGRLVLAANDLEQHNPDRVIVNPSYLAPYAYRVFAKVDTDHDWDKLAGDAYDLLAKSMDDALGSPQSAHLPPDWIVVDRHTGAVRAPDADTKLATTYGFEAIRLPWRLALDWQWSGDPRAKALLDRMSLLKDQWAANKRLAAVYGHDGAPQADYETPAAYGGAIGYFTVSAPDLADAVFREKLESLYDADAASWRKTLGYYDDNWAWFGIALHAKQLPDLFDEAIAPLATSTASTTP